MEYLHKRESFLRQRRNLMVISAAVMFLYVGGFQLTQINIVGNVFNVDNPERLLWVVDVLFVYFLLRYYQFFNAVKEEDSENQVHSVFLALYARIIWFFHYRSIREHFRREGGFDKITKINRIWAPDLYDPVKGMKRQVGTIVFQVDATGFLEGSEKKVHGGHGYIIEIPESGLVKALLWRIAALIVALSEYHFTEYFLPIIFALIASLSAFLSIFYGAR